MKIEQIKSHSFLMWKTRIENRGNLDHIRLLVKVHNVRLSFDKESVDLVDVVIPNGIDNKIFTVLPDSLYEIN